MKVQVPEKLLRGLDAVDREAMSTSYKNASWVLSRMREVLEKEIDMLIKYSEDDSAFEKPNYDEYQRDNRAQRKALRKIIHLLPKKEIEDDGKINNLTMEK